MGKKFPCGIDQLDGSLCSFLGEKKLMIGILPLDSLLNLIYINVAW